MTDRPAEGWPDPGEVRTERRPRWEGVVGVALAVAVGGAFARSGAVVLAGVLGVALSVAARAFAPPAPTVALERTVERTGDGAAVTLRVHNEGSSWLPDCRVVDGVPEGATVVDGAAACRTALAPGSTATVTYAVETGRGSYPFRPALVTTRDPAGLVERAATVLLVVDTREAAALAPGPAEPTAVERGVGAAARLFATLTDRGDRVGVATLDDDRRWLAPGLGRTHRTRARELLTDDRLRAGTATAFDPVRTAAWVADRAPPGTQVLALTPLCDDGMARFLVRLEALGLPVTVCSPDPTTGGSTGRRLAGLERDRRLRRCRDAGLTVVDWAPDTPLSGALAGRAGP